MVEERTLDLDVGAETGKQGKKPYTRVMVASAYGFTRDGGGPTLMPPCSSVADFDREIDRLEGELVELRERGRAELEGRAPELAEPAAGTPATSEPAARLDTDLRVGDVMTRDVKTLGRNDRLSLADELMKMGRFRHVVVLDEDDEVAGVVSQRDIFYGALAWSLGQGRTAHERTLESTAVKDVMRTDVVSIGPEAPLPGAAAVMMEHKLGCLPVLEGSRLVGILTEGDFLALLTGKRRPESD